MKKIFLLGAMCAFSAVFAEVLWEAKSVRDFENRRPVKAQEDGSYLVKKSAWVVGKPLFPTDPSKRYRVSCEVRALNDKAAAVKIRLGVTPRDVNKRGAGVSGVKPYAGTETEVVSPVAKGDKVIKVKDASKWIKNKPVILVYDADPSGQMRDIPNFDFVSGRPVKWELKGDVWEVTLNRAANVELSAGTVIRLHQDARAAIFSNSKALSKEWKSYEFILEPGISKDGTRSNQIFPGVAFIAPLVTLPPDSEFRNYKFEVVE